MAAVAERSRVSPSGTSEINPGPTTTEVRLFVSHDESVLRLPRKIKYAALTDGRLRFKRPIEVDLFKDAGAFVAYCRELEEFGMGDSPQLALEDLSRTLTESFFALTEEKDRLGSDLKHQLSRYEDILQPRTF
ncbi:MAG TPA: hypothetical protein VKX25_19315 [Bryobacteraceae bacterium]|jgi:hypothetical protein|nr:hypothetical protein [Bryobacteraceae bacterium]